MQIKESSLVNGEARKQLLLSSIAYLHPQPSWLAGGVLGLDKKNYTRTTTRSTKKIPPWDKDPYKSTKMFIPPKIKKQNFIKADLIK